MSAYDAKATAKHPVLRLRLGLLVFRRTMDRTMHKYMLTRRQIEEMDGLQKTHFLNDNARRTNKSLGDMTGLKSFGFHIIEIEPGRESTELHVHFHEEECVYILEGVAEATIGDATYTAGAGDFIAYPACGEPHKLENVGAGPLRCIVVGQRLPHDVADYPRLKKRIFRNQGLPWNLVDLNQIEEPAAGRKI
jgi:uncharacterized cupin superfamily protein